MILKKKVSEIIKRERKARKISQNQLADKLDVTQGYISQLEKGDTLPTKEITGEIAKIFKLSKKELWEIVQQEKALWEIKHHFSNYQKTFALEEQQPVEVFLNAMDYIYPPMKIFEQESDLDMVTDITNNFFYYSTAFLMRPDYERMVIHNITERKVEYLIFYPSKNSLIIDLAQRLKDRFKEYSNFQVIPLDELNSFFRISDTNNIGLYGSEGKYQFGLNLNPFEFDNLNNIVHLRLHERRFDEIVSWVLEKKQQLGIN